MKLLLFEWKKMFRMKGVVALFLLTIVCISLLFIRNVMEQEVIRMKKIEMFSEYESDILAATWFDEKKRHWKQAPLIDERLEVGVLLGTEIGNLMQHISEDRWQEELETEINVYELMGRYVALEGNIAVSEKDSQDIITLNKELIKQGLPKEDVDLSIQPSIFMKKVVSLLVTAPGFIILVFLVGMGITKEFEDNTIKMVYALPISRATYMFTKFVSLLVVAVIWLVLIFSFSYILPSLFGKSEGDIFQYPLFTASGTMMTTGTYIIKAIMYSIGFVIFAISLCIFLGFFLRNTIVTYLVVFFLFIGGMMLYNNGMTSFLYPFTYQQVDDVVLQMTGKDVIGFMILLSSAVLFLLGAVGINRKRGI